MKYVVTASEMRELDRITIEEIGLPGAVLMETAGRAVVAAVARRVPQGGTVAVCCGLGNNGGDGYVIARVLREQGVATTVYLAGARDRVSGDAAVHLGAFERCGGPVVAVDGSAQVAERAVEIENADVIVDALFGTGLARPIGGHYADLVEVINRAAAWRVAVDIPSGLSADTGAVLGVAVRADATVTMAFAKPALVTGAGVAWRGALEVAEIGIPVDLARKHGVRTALLDLADVAAWLPRVARSDHKSRRGHALVVAGSPGKRGAGRLAAISALRAGAGLVTLAGPGGGEIEAADPVMTARVDRVADFESLAVGKRAIAIGPGMDTEAAGAELVRAVVACDLPVVVDADALNHLAGHLEVIANGKAQCVLTPHPGEAARLLGTTAAQVEGDRLAAVRALAEKTGAVVLLKGAGTVVCDGNERDGIVTVNPTGGPGLATAGAGDVLTGVIAGLLAQGVPPAQAARLGAYLHGLAGDRCERSLGPASVIATDVIAALAPATQTVAGSRGRVPAV